MKDIEIEIKLKLEEPEKLMQWLEENASFVNEEHQIDRYFDPPEKSFILKNKFDGSKDADEWFRIRATKKGNEICYKKWHRDENGKSLYADEIETSIGDEETTLKILQSLGFKETSLIDKTRKSYRYKDFQFDCDDAKGIGFFVEIEFKGSIEDPTKGREMILDFLKEIGVANWKKTKRGMPWLQWNPDAEHYED